MDLSDLAVELRDPFEVLLIKRASAVLTKGRVYRIGGVDYCVDREPLVKAPEVPLEPTRFDPMSMFTAARRPQPPPRPDPPPVKLRKALRECASSGMTEEAIGEIVRLELVDFVMGS